MKYAWTRARSLPVIGEDVGLELIDGVAPPPPDDTIVIQGRPGWHLAVAVAAGATAAAYAGRLGAGGPALPWLLVVALTVVGLGAVCVANVLGWREARTPRLVADLQGVRVRSGRSWTGLPWDRVASVEVSARRHLLADSTLVVRPVDGPARTVGYGFSASVSRDDLPAALRQLSGGSVPVTVSSSSTASPPATAAPPEAAPAPRPQPPDATVTDLPAAPPPTTGPRRVAPLSVVSSARRAVRAQVRRQAPATAGSSALKTDPQLLPEVRELRGTGHRVGLVLETVTAPRPAPAEAQPPPAVAVGAAPVAAYPIAPAKTPFIGPQLAAARVRLGMSVDSLADRTRIRPHVIESVEVDDFAPCGGDFYARGHLRALCRVLGIDAAQPLHDYDELYASAPVDARRIFEAELATGSHSAIRSVGGGARWSGLLAVVLLLVIVWGVAKAVTDSTTETPVQLNSASPHEVVAPPSADPGRFAELGRSTPVVNSLRLKATADGSVVVRQRDGTVVWRGHLSAGQVHQVRVPGAAEVTVSAAGAIRVSVNGHHAQSLGRPAHPSTTTLGRRPRG
ncbi:MAG: helix-turn-helix domain-containing protein [Nocardioidaceae bacterium]